MQVDLLNRARADNSQGFGEKPGPNTQGGARRRQELNLCDSQVAAASCDFRLWHKAEVPLAYRDFRFRGLNGHSSGSQ